MCVAVGTVGLVDAASQAWIRETTRVEVIAPAAGDTTFSLFIAPESGGGAAADAAEINLARAEQLLALHCSIGALSKRTVYLLFTFWRITDVEDSHLQHPYTLINPEVQSPGRVFTALARTRHTAGATGAHRSIAR